MEKLGLRVYFGVVFDWRTAPLGSGGLSCLNCTRQQPCALQAPLAHFCGGQPELLGLCLK